jgi:electron transfer flavoprotein alpha subunit
MSILVFAELSGTKFSKATLEAVTYSKKIADAVGTSVSAIILENASDEELSALAAYGASKILKNNDARLHQFEPNAIAKALIAAVQQEAASALIFSSGYTSKAVAAIVAAKLKAGYIAGATSVPVINGNEWVVTKNVFSGKALANCSVSTPIKIISLLPNSIAPEKSESAVNISDFNPNLSDSDFRIKSLEVSKAGGKIALTDAELVVSGGRGLKGPENWGMIEEMAQLLGAATACSRAVADLHWRPHEEHVGQTGLTIRPNLYIAIGISGAIQHLAGVNGSKVIVVINTDPEAPFFKAADYGIVGDAFQVVPKLNEALKKFKATAH